MDSIPVDKITKWAAEFREHLTSTQVKLLETIATGNVTPEVEANIKKVVEAPSSHCSAPIYILTLATFILLQIPTVFATTIVC